MTCLYSGLIMGDISTPVHSQFVYLVDGIYKDACRIPWPETIPTPITKICEHLGCYWMILE